ncbi:cytochrome P450 [Hysterangium stoloniferum]|nr:cytochrome P450 [Hysterangium stoloniferum]
MLTVVFCSTAIVVIVYLRWKRGYTSLGSKSPPGPNPSWMVGHTFQVPQTRTWRYFDGLAKTFGPIVKLTLAGDDIVVLTDAKDAGELLGRRSHNYSSRKQLTYAGKHLSHNKRLILLPYGPLLKTQRQAFYQMLQPRVVDGYQPMQLLESSKLLFDSLTAPDKTFLNTKRFSASLVFTLTYGRRFSPDNAELKEVLGILDNFIENCYPGRHLVDTFPTLDSAWVPNFIATWRNKAREQHDREIKFYLRLLHDVKSRMDAGEHLESFAARLWEDSDKHGLDLESMAYVAGTAFEAGTGTTSGTLLFFFMAMILHPGALKKAQNEIDTALGSEEGPPTFEHFQSLPYCAALCKEVFRWIPVAPGGFPHLSDQDDNYKGYDIKAGTMVIPNIWSMHHDPSVFHDHAMFKPERFLKADGNLQMNDLAEGHYAFGFGRRACPGQYLAIRSVWIAIVQLMWGFHITHALDKDGKPIPIDTEAVTSAISIEPEQFEMRITPRSDLHVTIIRKLWMGHQARMAGSTSV